MGGREASGAQPQSHGATPSTSGNNFQARYAIRHGWTGPVACKDPHRGRWGGPVASADAGTRQAEGEPRPLPAQRLAFVPRGKLSLDAMLLGGAPAVAAVIAAAPPVDGGASADTAVATPSPKRASCGCLVGTEASSTGGLGGVLVALVAFARRRRR